MKTKKTLRKQITLVTLSLALLVTSVHYTLSWMDISDKWYGKPVYFQYGGSQEKPYSIGVEAVDMEVTLNTKGAGDDEYLPVARVEGEPLLKAEGMVPSDVLYFRLDIQNAAKSSLNINISFSRIYADRLDAATGRPYLADGLYLAFTGVSSSVDPTQQDASQRTFERVSDILIKSGTETLDDRDVTLWSMPFAKGLAVPAEDTLYIYGYLLFDRNAGVEYENCDFNIDRILIMT